MRNLQWGWRGLARTACQCLRVRDRQRGAESATQETSGHGSLTEIAHRRNEDRSTRDQRRSAQRAGSSRVPEPPRPDSDVEPRAGGASSCGIPHPTAAEAPCPRPERAEAAEDSESGVYSNLRAGNGSSGPWTPPPLIVGRRIARRARWRDTPEGRPWAAGLEPLPAGGAALAPPPGGPLGTGVRVDSTARRRSRVRRAPCAARADRRAGT